VTSYVYLNGGFLPTTDAKISVCDGGWLHGAGLFETMLAENGRIFRLESHVNRLMRSAARLLTPVQRDDLPSRVDFLELLERNELKVARVRMTVSAGSMRADAEPEVRSLTVCVTASPLSPPSPTAYETGVQVVICKFRQSPSDPLAGHKTTAYLSRLVSLRAAQEARCAEALWFTTANRLAEGSISNVFVVHKGVLKTPPLDTPVLPGIARGVVLALADEAGIQTDQCPLTIDDLLDADEVLLTNAIMQVLPVIRVERRDIGDGRVGSVAKRILEAYRRLVRKECGGE